MGTTGGFEFMLEALQGQEPAEMAAVARGLIGRPSQRPELAGVFSTFEATTPQVRLDIDRDKVAVLGINLSDIFAALQSTLGGYYINDFNAFGRTWKVQIQAEESFRKSIDQIYDIRVKNREGEMVPLSALRRAEPRGLAAQYRALQQLSGDLDQRAARRRALVTAMPSRRWKKLARTTLPQGYSYEWTGQALETKVSAGQTPLVMGFGIAVRLPVPRGPVRELEHADPGAAVGLGGGLGAVFGLWLWASFDALRADRLRRADRARGEERDSDRRVRRAAAP